MKQTTLTGVVIDAQPAGDGIALLIQVPHPHPLNPGQPAPLDELIVCPMTIEYAQDLGRKLMAPRVVSANSNGHVDSSQLRAV